MILGGKVGGYWDLAGRLEAIGIWREGWRLLGFGGKVGGYWDLAGRLEAIGIG